MSGYVLAVLAFVFWALVHSVTAARPFKAWARARMGERAYSGLYRLFYNAFSLITFLPVLAALAALLPARELWRWPRPWHWLALLVQLVGLAGATLSILQTDALSFGGLRQAYRYFAGEEDPDPPVPFTSRGVFRLVRHPLYFFSLLFLWFAPVVTVYTFVFNLLTTLYFWLGSLHEERRLTAEYGAEYEQYRNEVPAFVPFVRPGR